MVHFYAIIIIPLSNDDFMLIPIRCFTCGALVADKWEEYQQLKEQDLAPEEIFKKLDLDRYCCRRMLLSQVDLVDDVLKFSRQQ